MSKISNKDKSYNEEIELKIYDLEDKIYSLKSLLRTTHCEECGNDLSKPCAEYGCGVSYEF